MAVYTLQNPYHGVNAHLNSELQGAGDGDSMWTSFHHHSLIDIANALNDRLSAQYIARAEQSLQVYIDDVPRTRRPRADVGIYESKGLPRLPARLSTSAQVSDHVLVLDLVDEEEGEDRYVPAVVIREVSQKGQLGRVVTWIELLSRANKPGGSNNGVYRENRRQLLHGQTPLIEIDYLQESASLSTRLPVYPHETASHAYHVIVNDPRPQFNQGTLKDYFFDVDQLFPVVPLPLLGEEILPFDMSVAYSETFRRGRWGGSLDYSQPPIRFETYSADDQARISAVMERAQTLGVE